MEKPVYYMEHVDLLLLHAKQVATCAGLGPRRGAEMKSVGLIEEGAVAVRGGCITAVGPTAKIVEKYQADQTIDCTGKAVCPGFVDPHTHVVFGGDRAGEFELRIKGASYLEIMAAGGGIVSTVRHTRESSVEDLVTSAARRLDGMLALGTTTVEIKTGYGLDTANELKMLRVIEQLALEHPCTIVPTFLGAHTVPVEYKQDTERYIRLVIDDMLPEVMKWYGASLFSSRGVPLFIDVFCEDHAFDVDQSRRVLQAGIDRGLKAKIHVDQFNRFGGVTMAVELGAISADHLEVTDRIEIEALARSETIATPLPAVNFNLGAHAYADARGLVDAGAAVALATDINPGSAPCPSMPLVMAIACRFQSLLPSEALNAGTINAAYAIGLGNQIGSIEVEKQADLLILKEGDYRHIPYFFGGNPVETVIKNGHIVGESHDRSK
jgi:imidazolonepropionase